MRDSDFFLVLFSAMMHAGWNFFAKKSHANKIALLWFGWLSAGLIMLPFAILLTDFSNAEGPWILLLLLTACAHAAYLYTLGRCYNVGDLSVMYPISRGIAILLTIIMLVGLGVEELSGSGVLGILFLIIGIGLISIKKVRDFEKQKMMRLAAQVGGFISLYTVIDKLSLSYIPAFFYITAMFILTSLILMPILVKTLNAHTFAVIRKHKVYGALIGIVSFFTYYMILLAMSSAPASYIVALREISIVFGSILGMWILKEECSMRKISGILLIISGVYIIKTS